MHSDLFLSAQEQHNNWKQLRIFNFYRIALGGLLLSMDSLNIGPSILGERYPEIFTFASVIYFATFLIGAITSHFKSPNFNIQVHLQFYADMLLIGIIMHASGGLISGLGVLFVISVVGNSLLISGQMAFLFAALAAITLLTETVYSHIHLHILHTTYTHVGLLGAALFATAIITNTLANRAKKSEAIAIQKAIDLANMEVLNAHIIQLLQIGIIVVDSDMHIRLMNNAAQILLNVKTNFVQTKLIQLSKEIYQELQIWQHNPNHKPQISITSPGDLLEIHFIKLGTAAKAGILIFIENAAETHKKLQQIKLASLGRLTANIAHEIRNPLGAISHAAQLLKESEDLPIEDKKIIQIIEQQSKRVNTIIKDMLQLSSGGLPKGKWIHLKEWLYTFKEQFLLSEHLKTHQLELSIENSDIVIYIDSNHLQQILTNLCTNAVRYGTLPNKETFIHIKTGYIEGTHQVYLVIQDYGPGIPKNIVPKLFEPFFTTNTSSGSGLGLYLARELSALNKAKLDYIPTKQGSCFQIIFAEIIP